MANGPGLGARGHGRLDVGVGPTFMCLLYLTRGPQVSSEGCFSLWPCHSHKASVEMLAGYPWHEPIFDLHTCVISSSAQG